MRELTGHWKTSGKEVTCRLISRANTWRRRREESGPVTEWWCDSKAKAERDREEWDKNIQSTQWLR